MTETINVLCALCRKDISKDEFVDGGKRGKVADKHIFKAGEFSYIELAHTSCAKASAHANEWEWDEVDLPPLWEWDASESIWTFPIGDGLGIVIPVSGKFEVEYHIGAGPNLWVTEYGTYKTKEIAFGFVEKMAEA